jgi:DNA-binding NarL/FixJ family response regulator
VVGEAATAGDARRERTTAEALLVAIPHRGTEDQPYEEDLTPRELEVLELLAQGLPNKAIAQRLGISDQTVKFHVAALSGKLGASNRTRTVRLAMERGLVTF